MTTKRTLKRRVDAAVQAAKKVVTKQRTLARKQVSKTEKQLQATKRTLKRTTNELLRRTNNELQEIERMLGEDFESLTQARAALQRESKPITKKLPKKLSKPIFDFGANKKQKQKPAPVPKPTPVTKQKPTPVSKPKRANIYKMSRFQKHNYAQQVGLPKYVYLMRQWWDNHPEADPADNPYCYHAKEGQ